MSSSELIWSRLMLRDARQHEASLEEVKDQKIMVNWAWSTVHQESMVEVKRFHTCFPHLPCQLDACCTRVLSVHYEHQDTRGINRVSPVSFRVIPVLRLYSFVSIDCRILRIVEELCVDRRFFVSIWSVADFLIRKCERLVTRTKSEPSLVYWLLLPLGSQTSS